MEVNQADVDTLIQAVGAAILTDPEYTSIDWDALAIVANMMLGDKGTTGYTYLGAEWRPRTPDNTTAFIQTCLELQSAMTPPDGEPWKQALIHITKPGPEINIQFEYDDAKRWSLKKVSLDMSDYAESLRPPPK